MKSCHFYRIAQCSSKNSMTLSSFSMTFHDLCYLLSMTFQAWRIVYLNFMTFHEGRTLIDIQDIITYATFGDDRLRGLGVARGWISHFPIDLRRRPYNTLALLWQCVITIYTTGTTGVGMNNNHSTVLLFPLICAFMQPQLPEYPRALASWLSTASPVIILTQMCQVHSWMLLFVTAEVGWLGFNGTFSTNRPYRAIVAAVYFHSSAQYQSRGSTISPLSISCAVPSALVFFPIIRYATDLCTEISQLGFTTVTGLSQG